MTDGEYADSLARALYRCTQLEIEISHLKRDNARLREALIPFSAAANSNIDSNLNLLSAICSLTPDDFRRARDAVSALKENKNGGG